MRLDHWKNARTFIARASAHIMRSSHANEIHLLVWMSVCVFRLCLCDATLFTKCDTIFMINGYSFGCIVCLPTRILHWISQSVCRCSSFHLCLPLILSYSFPFSFSSSLILFCSCHFILTLCVSHFNFGKWKTFHFYYCLLVVSCFRTNDFHFRLI